MPKLILLLMLAVMMMLSAGFQNQNCEVKYNEDGSIDIRFNGARYLGLTRKQVDDWQKLQNDHDTCQGNLKDLETERDRLKHEAGLKDQDIAHLNEKASLLQSDLDRERENGKRNFGLLVAEQQLRAESGQFIPHGEGKGFLTKVLTFLDRPESQAFFKIGAPIYQMARCK